MLTDQVPKGEWAIRYATASDAGRIAVLARQFADANPSSSATADADMANSASAAEDVLEAGTLSILVAVRGEELVGLVTTVDIPSVVHGGRPSTFIDLLVVAEASRRRGVGSSLIAEALRLSAERGAYKASLYFNGTNDSARSLYASMGFSVTGEAYAIYLS